LLVKGTERVLTEKTRKGDKATAEEKNLEELKLELNCDFVIGIC
jgi:hypothetical protein